MTKSARIQNAAAQHLRLAAESFEPAKYGPGGLESYRNEIWIAESYWYATLRLPHLSETFENSSADHLIRACQTLCGNEYNGPNSSEYRKQVFQAENDWFNMKGSHVIPKAKKSSAEYLDLASDAFDRSEFNGENKYLYRGVMLPCGLDKIYDYSWGLSA